MNNNFYYDLIDYCCKTCNGSNITRNEKLVLANEMELGASKYKNITDYHLKRLVCNYLDLDPFYDVKQIAHRLGISYDRRYKSSK